MEKIELITVLGPTASGKTAFAAVLAKQMNTEIISADSRQVYRRMDIGTGKDPDDYKVEGISIPCHLIDVCEPGTKYNVFQYQHDFFSIFRQLREKEKIPILCGGTGMYIEAVLKGYRLPDVPPDPALRESLKEKPLPELKKILASYKTLHNKTDVDSAQRAIRAIEIEEYHLKKSPGKSEFEPVNSLIIGIDISRELRREKISGRLQRRLDEGMIDEVRKLIDSGIHPDDLIYYGLEYKYLTLYITGSLTYQEMTRQLEIAIHRFAKRQMTWFRGMERRGFTIHWIDASIPAEEKAAYVMHKLTDISSN
ncbi:MAG: tRNA (adenosine(37)-N6)-dimethylallyltransferase MiaA [Tannerella sp.]|jgi:tRNA dimethylallyltransferase|nr:tRNA (adenosine(37)-N6)-dimethylallyltransferase MiaA [Tannerella sp.]